MDIAIVDLAHICRTHWHASEGQPLSTMVEKSVAALWRIKDAGHDRLVCMLDAPPYKRNDIDPDYKANRESVSPVYFEQYRLVQEKAKGLGFHVMECKGYEADDLIATAVEQIAGEHRVAIYTNDKDLLQLVNETGHVRAVSTADWKTREMADVAEKFGVPPNRLGDWLALVGDTSDNIPGCPKVGAKTATKLLEHNNLSEIWAHLEEGREPLGASPSVVATLRENMARVKLSRQLVELMTDAPIDISVIYKEETKEMEEPSMADEEYLEASMRDMEREAIKAESRGSASLLARDDEEAADIVKAANARAAEIQLDHPPAHHAPRPSGIDSIELRPGLHLSRESYNLMKELAKNFHDGGMYQRKFNSPQAIFTVMMLGMELGVAPQTACQNFHMIEGRPSPAAHFLIALAKRDPDCVYLECEEETATSVTYVTKKKSFPKEQRFSYSLQDAANDQQRWAGNKKNQRAMLRKTAGSQAARLWYPEACNGLYSQEEMGFDAEAGE